MTSHVHRFVAKPTKEYSQGRSTKIKTGQAIDEVTQTRGAGGMSPKENF